MDMTKLERACELINGKCSGNTLIVFLRRMSLTAPDDFPGLAGSCSKLGTSVSLTSGFHSLFNGEVEWTNQEVKAARQKVTSR